MNLTSEHYACICRVLLNVVFLDYPKNYNLLHNREDSNSQLAKSLRNLSIESLCGSLSFDLMLQLLSGD